MICQSRCPCKMTKKTVAEMRFDGTPHPKDVRPLPVLREAGGERLGDAMGRSQATSGYVALNML